MGQAVRSLHAALASQIRHKRRWAGEGGCACCMHGCPHGRPLGPLPWHSGVRPRCAPTPPSTPPPGHGVPHHRGRRGDAALPSPGGGGRGAGAGEARVPWLNRSPCSARTAWGGAIALGGVGPRPTPSPPHPTPPHPTPLHPPAFLLLAQPRPRQQGRGRDRARRRGPRSLQRRPHMVCKPPSAAPTPTPGAPPRPVPPARHGASSPPLRGLSPDYSSPPPPQGAGDAPGLLGVQDGRRLSGGRPGRRVCVRRRLPRDRGHRHQPARGCAQGSWGGGVSRGGRGAVRAIVSSG